MFKFKGRYIEMTACFAAMKNRRSSCCASAAACTSARVCRIMDTIILVVSIILICLVVLLGQAMLCS